MSRSSTLGFPSVKHRVCRLSEVRQLMPGIRSKWRPSISSSTAGKCLVRLVPHDDVELRKALKDFPVQHRGVWPAEKNWQTWLPALEMRGTPMAKMKLQPSVVNPTASGSWAAMSRRRRS